MLNTSDVAKTNGSITVALRRTVRPHLIMRTGVYKKRVDERDPMSYTIIRVVEQGKMEGSSR